MCDFLSGKIVKTEKGLDVIFPQNLESHDEIRDERGYAVPGYEFEWTEDDRGDSLYIRSYDGYSEDENLYTSGKLREWMLSHWPTRTRMINHALSITKFDGSSRLRLIYTLIRKLPDNLHVYSLYLDGCKHLRSLPNGLKVESNLSVDDTNITEIPADFEGTPGSSLWIQNSKVRKLPDGLRIGNNLYAAHSDLEELPKGLFVKGTLDIRGTKVSVIPDEAKIGRIIAKEGQIVSCPSHLLDRIC